MGAGPADSRTCKCITISVKGGGGNGETHYVRAVVVVAVTGESSPHDRLCLHLEPGRREVD